VQLSNADDNSIRLLIRNDVTSPKVKEALQRALDLKAKVEQARQDLAHAQQQLTDIERDQQRIRANLKETPPTAQAYRKYLAKLDSQETEVDALRDQIKKFQDEQLARQKDYDAFLANLDVE
jgi:chromosome segregation ATPase